MDAALVIVFCLFLVESNESGVLFRHALHAPLCLIDTVLFCKSTLNDFFQYTLEAGQNRSYTPNVDKCEHLCYPAYVVRRGVWSRAWAVVERSNDDRRKRSRPKRRCP